ncbi:MAG: hypothetical protein KatS3mg099_168 [Candidatus Parcubacteria bacterium]|nr:MAG: hypothetical protein KatS3mg099_168 [Candidatus Parcubacteria bacterium]
MRQHIPAYSLIEALVIIALVGLVAAAMSNIVLAISRTHRYAFEQASAVNEGRRAIARMGDLVRTATYGEDGSYPLAEVATSSLTLYADEDRDGTVEKVRFWLSGDDLYETVASAQGAPPAYGSGTTHVLASYLRNAEDNLPVFVAYDAQGAQLPMPAPVLQVRTVHIQLIVNVARERAPGDFTITTTANLRNTRLSD